MATTTDDGDTAVRDKIAQLPAFQDVATRLHELILNASPDLEPRLWYGMPGYAPAKGKSVVCFFRVDNDQYVTFGLTEKAHLEPDPDSGHQLMGCAWFLTSLDTPTEQRIAEIVCSAAFIP